jgi:hypothetical protein
MNQIASILYAFNGGVSCNQVYINQNDFFVTRVLEAIPFALEDE